MKRQLELNPLEVYRTVVAKGHRVLGVTLETDFKERFLEQLDELAEKFGIAITHFQVSRPLRDKTAKCFAFIEIENSELSIKEIKELLKKQKFVKALKTVEPLKQEIIGDIYHFPIITLDQRAIMLEKNVYAAIFKDIRELFGTAANAFLYYMGFGTGKKLYLRLIELTNGPQLEALMKALRIANLSMGWGIIKDIYVDKILKKAAVVVYENFECDLGKRSTTPYSHFYRGVLAGFFTEYFGEEMTAEETKCIAKGDNYCRFKIRKACKSL